VFRNKKSRSSNFSDANKAMIEENAPNQTVNQEKALRVRNEYILGRK
jgi:hypothetical protein